MPPQGPQTESMPPQTAAIIGLIWFLFMGMIIVSYVFMVIALWKGMRAHQKIADKLDKLTDRLQLK